MSSSCKLTTLCVVAALLLLLSLTSTAREMPSSPDVSTMKVQREGLKDAEVEKVMAEESCEGVGEEECLMRRTLAAHIDYIYTQKTKP